MRLSALVLFGISTSTALATAPTDSSKIDLNYLSDLRRELACYCPCGMTVQDCLGGMVCSESRTVSKEVIQLVEQGNSREQVLQAMVAKYGESILSAPTKKGFNLTAWVVPFLVLLAGGAISAWIVIRWRRETAPASGPRPASQPAEAGAYGNRFEEEFRDFDK